MDRGGLRTAACGLWQTYSPFIQAGRQPLLSVLAAVLYLPLVGT